jgi:recombinational DNA repair protein (RecF pathway)
LTPDRGKLELLGQGTRKAGSKLAGALATPGVLELHIARGKVVDRVAGVEVVRPFVWPTLAHRIAAQAWCELVERTTKHGKPDRELYDLVLEVFEKISVISAPLSVIPAEAGLSRSPAQTAWDDILNTAAWRLLDVLGFRPRLTVCHNCGRRDELVIFDPRGGGALCVFCHARVTDDRPLLPLPAETTRGLTTYLAEHLGVPWRGREVVETARG